MKIFAGVFGDFKLKQTFEMTFSTNETPTNNE
jgi:hypothetical protein